MAPSHALREEINEIVRERLVSRGYTNAEKSLAVHYGAGGRAGRRRWATIFFAGQSR